MDLFLYFLFKFFLYGFVGWILENVYCYFKTGHMQKEGFLYSPFKPMYAIAMSVLVLCSKVERVDNYTIVGLCAIIPTFVEFITGYIMREYFNKDYWNYSDLKYNYKGIICLEFSITWTVLSIIVIKYLQVNLVDKLYIYVNNYWNSIWYIFIIGLILDSIKSIKVIQLKNKAIN